LKKAASLNADSAAAQLQLGRVYLETDVYDAAQTHLERAALLEPKIRCRMICSGKCTSNAACSTPRSRRSPRPRNWAAHRVPGSSGQRLRREEEITRVQ